MLRGQPPKSAQRLDLEPRPARPSPAARALAREHAAELEQIRAEAHHHRERLALYRARVLSSNPTSRARLQDLERISAAADARLDRTGRGERHVDG